MTDTVAPADDAPEGEPAPEPERDARGLDSWRALRRRVPVDAAIRWLTVLTLTVVAVVPVAGNEVRVQDVDPMFMRNMVERASVFGGSYYESAIQNRGPLEPFLYDIAGRVISYDGFWFVISFMVAVIAAVIAYAGARTARFAGANRSVALAVAAVVYVHFTFSDQGYARVLYIRNVTTLLLALVWIVALSDGLWTDPRRARRASIVVGALLGLVVQQLLTSVFAGAVVGLVALALLYERRGRDELPGHLRAAVAAAVVAFLATPVWYVARGSFDEYWSGWWVYARYMSVGTGRSLTDQFALGWDQFYDYYSHNPLLVFLVGGFVAVTWLVWRDLDRRVRIVHAGLGAWFAAAWLELILSQRYSPHYFSVLAVPTAFMGATLAGHTVRMVAARRPASRTSLAVPLVATVLAIYLTGPSVFIDSVEQTSKFTSVSEWARERDGNLGGGDRSVRAILDLVSEEQDGLLAWTIDPLVYLRYHRVPATRFQWKSFMLGQVYLGNTGPQYVLPGTWKWFADDIEESDPVAFTETEPFESDTPFEDLIRSEFTEVYPGNAARVWLRRDAAAQLLDPNATRAWRDPGGRVDGSGWTVEDNRARFAGSGIARPDDVLYLATGPCFRLEGTVDVLPSGTLANIAFRFDSDQDPTEERQFLALEGDRAGSGSQGLGSLGFESLPANIGGDGPVSFALVVGRHSAALIVNGEVQAAVRLRDSVMRVTLESRTTEVDLSDLKVGDAPAGGGCAGPSD